MDWILNHGPDLVKVLSLLIAACAIISAWTPNEWDNKIVNGIQKLIDFIGQNYGNAKNSK